MSVKSVSLLPEQWGEICARLETSPLPDAAKYVGLIKEQVSGQVSVRRGRGGSITLKAGKGVDLRGSDLLR